MKKNLILPIAGESSRFPKEKPKWYIKHPSGNSMLYESISKLPFKIFDDIYIIGLKSHSSFIEEVRKEISEKTGKNAIKIILEKQTYSQPETIYYGIKKEKIIGSILIKDCDGQFEYSPDWKSNHVAVGNLETAGKLNAGNKSYVKIDKNNTIGNIAEKKIISNLFSVGGYFFVSSLEFCKYFEKIRAEKIYVSHVIFSMLLDKIPFFVEEVKNYKDWGTIEDWMDYIREIYSDKTIVIDMDDTIAGVENKPYIERNPKIEVIEKLRLAKKNGYYVIISTSRNVNTYRANVGIITKNTVPDIFEYLKKHDIPYDELRVNFPWCGHNGFYVNDRNITVKEFVDLSFEEINKKFKR